MMNALLLTAEQAALLLEANAASNDPTRRIEPRLLEDGAYILNADILDDPHFANEAKPWRAILTQIERPRVGAKTLEQLDTEDLTARAARTAVETAVHES